MKSENNQLLSLLNEVIKFGRKPIVEAFISVQRCR